MEKMNYAFRAPDELMNLVKQLEQRTGMSLSEIAEESLTLYLRHVKRNKGMMLPDFTLAVMRPEEKYLGRFTPPRSLEDAKDRSPLF